MSKLLYRNLPKLTIMNTFKSIFIVLLTAVLLVLGYAVRERIYPLQLVNQHAVNHGLWDSIAINGYDAVSYHIQKVAVRGDLSISSQWRGSTWLFSSTLNRKYFEQSPLRFAPLFGGYCVNAGTFGFTANSDPQIFEILDGRLILFSSKDVRKEWMANMEDNLEECTTNWTD